MIIVLDNAESILDLQEASGQDTDVVVEELNRFDNVCLCITSRTTTVPRLRNARNPDAVDEGRL